MPVSEHSPGSAASVAGRRRIFSGLTRNEADEPEAARAKSPKSEFEAPTKPATKTLAGLS